MWGHSYSIDVYSVFTLSPDPDRTRSNGLSERRDDVAALCAPLLELKQERRRERRPWDLRVVCVFFFLEGACRLIVIIVTTRLIYCNIIFVTIHIYM